MSSEASGPRPPAPPGVEEGRALGSRVPTDAHPGVDELSSIYRTMLSTRLIEERLMQLYRENRVTGGVYLGMGNEATSVGSAWALEERDVLVPTHRDLGAHLVRGHTPLDIMRQYLKRATAQTGGKDSGLHLGVEGSNIVGMISHLAHMMPVAAGVALAERQKGSPIFVLTTVGDGSTSLGDFHESLNFAAVQRLPVLFVIVNNQYAYSTPNTIQYACDKLSDRALGYGMAGEQIDGTDVIEVLDAARRARRRGLAGEGPTLIESVTMRMRGHSEHDDHAYVPKELLETWRQLDPLGRLERHLRTLGESDRFFEDARSELAQALDAAVDQADAEPLPNGTDAGRDVFRLWPEQWTVPDGSELWSEKP